MFVRCKKRFKDGKEHRYWSVVENVRVSGGRVVQRQVLYLGEINDSQRAAWCRSIEVVEGASRSKQVALFPEDREAPELECEVVQVRLAELTLCCLSLSLVGTPRYLTGLFRRRIAWDDGAIREGCGAGEVAFSMKSLLWKG